jgi:negative regulator of flagellin synthesis FlgM
MKVNNISNAEVYKAYNANSPEQANVKSEVPRKPNGSSSPVQDKVNISNKVQQMREIDKAVSVAPEIRKEKVAEVEQKIKSGAYQTDYSVIADKLLNPDPAARI